MQYRRCNIEIQHVGIYELVALHKKIFALILIIRVSNYKIKNNKTTMIVNAVYFMQKRIINAI